MSDDTDYLLRRLRVARATVPQDGPTDRILAQAHDEIERLRHGPLRDDEPTRCTAGEVRQIMDEAEALEAENERLRRQVDEAEEKLAFLAAGCVNLTREELVQRITAVEPARWSAGVWIEQQKRPLVRGNERLREALHQIAKYEVPFTTMSVQQFAHDALAAASLSETGGEGA